MIEIVATKEIAAFEIRFLGLIEARKDETVNIHIIVFIIVENEAICSKISIRILYKGLPHRVLNLTFAKQKVIIMRPIAHENLISGSVIPVTDHSESLSR